jgi:hypothetical protein
VPPDPTSASAPDGPPAGGVDVTGLVKPLLLPDGFVAPARLVHDDLVGRALSRRDLDADLAAVNASVELIRTTRGGGWPEGLVTADDDFVDLVWHEHEHRENLSFAYAAYASDRDYVGCCYLYPLGRRTPLTHELLAHDVDISWWVTPEAHATGWYGRVYEALRTWAVRDFPFTAPYCSNVVAPVPEV